MKNLNHIIFVIVFSIGIVHAGCGSCNVSKKKAEKPVGDFVTKINEDGTIKGLVLASCGMCNFGMRNKNCSLAIQINEKGYDVKGTKIDDHGDSHAVNGFCNAVRVAEVSGKIKKNKFIADAFVLQKD
jgi:hypothetical protein|tara:strand:+ start:857 stop:1240 length:384 start_codon:yes stop_codon:yes gene_type:complete